MLDLEAINKLRVLDGKEPLTELPKVEAPIITDPKEEKIPETEKIPVAEIVAELTDDAVLKFLQKKGITANSFDELVPKVVEDPVILAEQRESAILTYGLSKGKFNKKKYENFVRDNSNAQDLVFQQFYAESKEADTELSDEHINVEFAAKFGLDTEPGTRKHKRGQLEINLLASQILQNKYKDIYSAEQEYNQYESSQKQQVEKRKKIEAGAPVYKDTLDKVFVNLKKISAQVDQDEVYEIQVLDESLNSIRNLMSDPEWAAAQILNGYTEKDLQEIAYTRFLRDNLPFILKETTKQALQKQQKGLRGIPVTPAPGKQEDHHTFTPEQQKFIDIVKSSQPVAAASN